MTQTDDIVTVLNTHRVRLNYVNKPEHGLIASCGCGWQSEKIWKMPMTWLEDEPNRHAAWVTAFEHLANMIIEEGVGGG